MEIIFTLPLPHKHLSPNGRAHWRAKAKVTAEHVEEAINVVTSAIESGLISRDSIPWTRVESREIYYWGSRRRRDVRNAEGSLKAYYDGFVRSGLLEDDDIDHLTHMPSGFEIDREDPRVEIILTNLDIS